MKSILGGIIKTKPTKVEGLQKEKWTAELFDTLKAATILIIDINDQIRNQ